MYENALQRKLAKENHIYLKFSLDTLGKNNIGQIGFLYRARKDLFFPVKLTKLGTILYSSRDTHSNRL